MLTRHRPLLLIAASATGLVLAGCGGASDSLETAPISASGAHSPATSALAEAELGSVRLAGGWVVATTPMTAMSASPTAGSSTMSAAYAVIENTGDTDDELVAVSTPAAREAQLHTTVENSAGAGTMKRVDTVPVPAHGTATLRMGGYHVMLMDLTGPLREGERIAMTWTFRSGTSMTTTFPVIAREHRPGA